MPPGARRSHVTRLVVMLRTHALSLGMAPGAAPGDQLACNEAAASHLGTSIRGLFSLLYSLVLRLILTRSLRPALLGTARGHSHGARLSFESVSLLH